MPRGEGRDLGLGTVTGCGRGGAGGGSSGPWSEALPSTSDVSSLFLFLKDFII